MKRIFPLLFSITSLVSNAQSLEDYFPLKLFFANDEPNPRSFSAETKSTYEDCFRSYELKFEEYKQQGEMFTFLMDSDIIPNYQKLKELKQTLVDTLLLGKRVVLQVKGFASPLHNLDYNLHISQRRISSFVNELMRNDKELSSDDLLPKYINEGKLVIVELPFGEYSANATVNDNIDSLSKSVFHISPSYERRIEIEKVLILPESAPYLYSETCFKNLGKVKEGEVIKWSFPLKNIGNETLEIDRVAVSCGCSIADINNMQLAPNQEEIMNIEIDTKELALGKEVKSFTVFYNNGISKRYTVLLELVE